MANEVAATGVSHHGWASASYIPQLDTVTEKNGNPLIITSEQKLAEVAKRIGLSGESASKIGHAINLNERDIILIYYITPGSNCNHGVEKIERLASQIHVSVVEFGHPGSLSLCSMGGNVVVLSVPKKIKDEFVVECDSVDIRSAPEYNGLNIKEANSKFKAASGSYEYELDSRVSRYARCKDDTEEQIKWKGWFDRLSSKDRSLALKKLSAYEEYAAFEAKTDAAFRAAAARLCGQSFDREYTSSISSTSADISVPSVSSSPALVRLRPFHHIKESGMSNPFSRITLLKIGVVAMAVCLAGLNYLVYRDSVKDK